MPGRISQTDIAAIRDQIHLEDIIGDYVQLARAGSDSLKGLCPFHQEKTPSFHVRPSQGLFHCFGCGEGGDVYTFIQKIECISFAESVELLANRIGYSLERTTSSSKGITSQRGTRARLLAANKAAAQFYAHYLDDPEAEPARQFLHSRQFPQEIIHQFGCGFAPSGWDRLTRHLQHHGFSFSELEAAGLSRQTPNGLIDRFHRRLMWPICNSAGEVVGFGARRLFDDDPIAAKYVNTPETVIYKKSRTLFGLDQAKREIARTNHAVVVEGYTDVMAMHCAGITNAVAACGTAFGDEHRELLRRLMKDDNIFRSQILYVFDGDQAGQAAALKALEGDQQLVGRSFVSIIDQGMDPCDLRLAQGDQALVHLVDKGATPLIGFAIGKAIDQGRNITHSEDQVAALHQCIPMLTHIKDPLLREEYIIKVAGWINWDVNRVATLVRQATRVPSPPSSSRESSKRSSCPTEPNRGEGYDKLQREALKIVLQYPQLVRAYCDTITAESFTHPRYEQIWTMIHQAGGAGKLAEFPTSTQRIDYLCQYHHRDLTTVFSELSVETILTRGTSVEAITYYGECVFTRLRLLWVDQQINELKTQLQRMSPLQDRDHYYELFEDLVAMQAYSRSLQERSRHDGFSLSESSPSP